MRPAGAPGRLRRILFAGIVLSAIWAVVWYRGLPTDEDAPVPTRRSVETSEADMVIRDFRHVETRMDRTVWVLEASKAEVFEERARLTRVKITWFGQEGSHEVVITSRTGRVDLRTRNAVLSGDVRVVRDDGAKLRTRRLVWHDARRLLRAPLPVLVQTKDFTFRGRHLTANIERRWVKLGGRVRGKIYNVAGLSGRPST